MSDWAGRIGVSSPDHAPPRRITMSVTRSRRKRTLQVLADDTATISRAGSALLVELADRLGLTDGLCKAMAPTRERRSAHDPGRVVRDLALMLADGGDCLSDLGVLRDQVDLFEATPNRTSAARAAPCATLPSHERRSGPPWPSVRRRVIGGDRQAPPALDFG